jgi:hypothetical protein
LTATDWSNASDRSKLWNDLLELTGASFPEKPKSKLNPLALAALLQSVAVNKSTSA